MKRQLKTTFCHHCLDNQRRRFLQMVANRYIITKIFTDLTYLTFVYMKFRDSVLWVNFFQYKTFFLNLYLVALPFPSASRISFAQHLLTKFLTRFTDKSGIFSMNEEIGAESSLPTIS